METSKEYQRGGRKPSKGVGYFHPDRRAARKRKRETRRRNKKKGVFCTENDTSPDCTDPIFAKDGGFIEPFIEEI